MKLLACFGAIAGLAYATVETSLLIWVPWIYEPGYAYSALPVGFSLFLAAMSAAVGAAAAVLLGEGVLRLGLPKRSLTAIGGLTISIGYLSVVGGWADLRRPSDRIGLAIAVVGLTAAVGAARGRTFLQPLTVPVVVAALILIPTQLVSDVFASASPSTRVAVGVGSMAAICVAALGFRGMTTGANAFVWSNRRRLGIWALAAAVVSFSGQFAQPRPVVQPIVSGPPAAGPNLLLIVLDTVSAKHLSLYGYERDTSPNLSLFARDAVVFDRAYSSGSMSLPSHASLFTGLDPETHQAHYDPKTGQPAPLAQEFDTLAEILTTAGYRSSAVTANYGFFQPYFGLLQGFERVEPFAASAPLSRAPEFTIRQVVRKAVRPLLPERLSDRTTRRANEINRSALAEIKRLGESERPFFLFLNYMDAHKPYLPPEPFERLFPGRAPRFDIERYESLEGRVLFGHERITDEERNHLISQYDGSIAYLDQQIGLLFDALKHRKLYDDMVIIVTSDHGEAFGRDGLLFHGVTVRQENISVPLLIKPSRRSGGYAGERALQPVDSTDVFATALDAVGLPVPQGTSGNSQLDPVIDSARTVVSRNYSSPGDTGKDVLLPSAAAMSGRFKLVKPEGLEPRLYDLEADPEERRNLFRSDDPIAAKLLERLQAASNSPDLRNAEQSPVPADASDRLRSLGYLN